MSPSSTARSAARVVAVVAMPEDGIGTGRPGIPTETWVSTVLFVLARRVLVVIFSRRGLVPAGVGAGVQGTRFRVVPRCSVWLPSWRAVRRSPPLTPFLLIFGRCRVRAEPAFFWRLALYFLRRGTGPGCGGKLAQVIDQDVGSVSAKSVALAGLVGVGDGRCTGAVCGENVGRRVADQNARAGPDFVERHRAVHEVRVRLEQRRVGLSAAGDTELVIFPV